MPFGVVALLIAIGASCGTERSGVGSSGGASSSGGGDACGVPRPGCPCAPSQTGDVDECGKVLEHSGDYVLCSRGITTCDGTKWGDCTSATLATRHIPTLPGPATQSVRTLAFGTAAPCPTADANDPLSNVCDPYCHQYIDDPAGIPLGDSGLTVSDGGLTIGAVTGDGGASNVSFQTASNGESACPGGTNLRTNPCDATNQYTRCQQDFRCDTATSACVWNGGEGYFDPAAGGVDLTIGAACAASGQELVPVCNRGSTSVPPNTVVNVHIGGPSPTADSCAPTAPVSCFRNVGPGGLLPGKCMSIPCFISGNSYATVSGATEAPGRCANNQAYVKVDGSGCATCSTCTTRLTGTIRDPRGVNPLPGALVYVPSTTPSPMPATIGCDTCTSLATGAPVSVAVTSYDGTFTLDNVPSGTPFNLVILVGRWRRQVTVPAIAPCTSATLSPTLARLPRNKAEGDIPRVAIVMAAGDHTECLMRQIGVDDAEFTNAAGNGRIHLYSSNGHTIAGATNGINNLIGNATTLSSYSAVMMPCDNSIGSLPTQPSATPPTHATNAAQQANMKSYLDAGGRLFASHWFSVDFVHQPYPTAANHVYSTRTDNDREPPAFAFNIDTTHVAGQTFANWANLVGASPGGYGTVTFDSWRHVTETVPPSTVRFAYGDSRSPPISRSQTPAPSTSVWGGPIVSIFGFDTPVGGPACGRVMLPMSHVTPGNNGTFPGACGSAATAMTAQQKAFEFLVFYSQACLGPPPTPVIPPPPPALPAVRFYRDFEGVCPPGAFPKWGYFYWQSQTPPGTSIDFRAATADDQASLPPSPPGPAPATVPIGQAATPAVVAAPNWAWDTGPAPAGTVDYHLQTDGNTKSRRWLRVYMQFNPVGPIGPVLNAWRQQFSCEPKE
ncbi:MAG: hypothetical protein BGO98_17085 [Myxococcales bacterium 68-20]|nr:MAG: hypothetical protein BGO98_17085 [Myxococcales bacterium 68-20]